MTSPQRSTVQACSPELEVKVEIVHRVFMGHLKSVLSLETVLDVMLLYVESSILLVNGSVLLVFCQNIVRCRTKKKNYYKNSCCIKPLSCC